MKWKNKQIIALLVICSFITISMMVDWKPVKSNDFYFTLVAKTNWGGVRPDYLNFLKQQVARIGINIDVIVQDWPTLLGELVVFHDFDICYIEISGSGFDPNFSGFYSENGTLNIAGYREELDWNTSLSLNGRSGWGTNEWFIQKGLQIMPPNSQQRINHYWTWEQHLMDKILPILPTFTAKSYSTNWDNLKEFNYSKGLLQSWGKLNWVGSHPGQLSTGEIVIAGVESNNQNPLFLYDCCCHTLTGYILDPLIWYDSDLRVYPHLAANWTHINDTHIRITLRQNIKWQTDPDDLFPDEYLDAKDVYFTFYCINYLTSHYGEKSIIKQIEIIDNYTIDFFIDGDPDTPENEPTVEYLPFLKQYILPEHYLNQTQIEDGITPDFTDVSWPQFDIHPFGTSLFQIYSYTQAVEDELEVFEDCWWLNSTITNDELLEWSQRFGDFTLNPTKLRIRFMDSLELKISELKDGRLDILFGLSSALLNQNFVNKAEQNFEIQSVFLWNLGFYGFNLRENRPNIGNEDPCPWNPSISKGLAIRKAICYAINRNEINDVIYNGEMEINHWPIFQKLGIWCNPNIIKYDFDLDKARSIMGISPTTSTFYATIEYLGITILCLIGYCLLTIKKYKK